MCPLWCLCSPQFENTDLKSERFTLPPLTVPVTVQVLWVTNGTTRMITFAGVPPTNTANCYVRINTQATRKKTPASPPQVFWGFFVSNCRWYFFILPSIKSGMLDSNASVKFVVLNRNTVLLPHLQTCFPCLGFTLVTFCLSFSGRSTGKESRPLRRVWSCTRMLHQQMLVFPWNCSPKTLTHCKVPTPTSLLFRSLSFSLQTAVHRGSWIVLVSEIVLALFLFKGF